MTSTDLTASPDLAAQSAESFETLIALNVSDSDNCLPEKMFYHEVVRRATARVPSAVTTHSFCCEAEGVPKGLCERMLLIDETPEEQRLLGLVHDDDGTALLALRGGIWEITALHTTIEEARALVQKWAKTVRELCDGAESETELDTRAPGEISLRAWCMTPRGPKSTVQTIDVPSWESVRAGYAGETQYAVDRLMQLDAVPESGRLVLLHGTPGSGKTFLIRALMNAWASWCESAVITDAGELLDGGASYMVEILNRERRPNPSGRKKALLLVLEDAGDHLKTADRRDGLSRILNLADGLLGQGQDVLLCMTTNDPLSSVTEAVTRPGRCLATVEVAALSIGEANAWLAAKAPKGAPVIKVTRPSTLAELYALVNGEPAGQGSAHRRPIGFTADRG